MNKILFTLLLTLFMSPGFSHDGPPVPEPMNLDQLLQAFGWNMAEAEIKVQRINDNFHVLFGLGGNIAVSIGDDGVLIVDDQFPALMPPG